MCARTATRSTTPKRPKLFARCEGSYLYDRAGRPYLDLQMWYSAVNLGYANRRVNDALKRQIDVLPQLACQYLHAEKIELAARLADESRRAFGEDGRVHFNVGGSQAVEDALKLVRRNTGRSRMLAFEGGYHGRTLGASAITSSYRYREPFGEFADRAEFVPFPYCFRCPYGKKRDELRSLLRLARSSGSSSTSTPARGIRGPATRSSAPSSSKSCRGRADT